jgi:hypothetical protein
VPASPVGRGFEGMFQMGLTGSWFNEDSLGLFT